MQKKINHNNFIDNISSLDEEYSKKINSINMQELLQYMFIPDNFADLKNL